MFAISAAQSRLALVSIEHFSACVARSNPNHDLFIDMIRTEECGLTFYSNSSSCHDNSNTVKLNLIMKPKSRRVETTRMKPSTSPVAGGGVL
jgi:hypothetical protein